MALTSLTLVQIGDVHFPESKDKTFSDVKDGGFPGAVAERILLRPLQCVVRALAKELENEPQALLFCGDLTSKGNVDGYLQCLSYLKDLVNFKRWPAERIHAVPGNHDVDRSRIDPAGKDLFKKFEAFGQLWKDFGLPILTVDRFRATQIALRKPKGSGVHIFSLNSSLGCGEKRHLPPEIADNLERLLKEYETAVGKSAAFPLLGETLDTPAFDQNDVENICARIDELASTNIPIIVAHHNILPQALPRLAMYTETINAGIVRSRLSHLQRPVLYCHGHIHDHPLEVVHEPEYAGSKVVCISAPEFVCGFNSIRIEFSARSQPLGCVIVNHKLNARDYEVRAYEVRVPFYTATPKVPRKVADPALLRILSVLPDREERFDNVRSESGLSKGGLANALLEGEWLGLLAVQDREEEPQYWTVKKVMR